MCRCRRFSPSLFQVLVDCPSTGVPRMGLSYKNLVLTDFKIDIPVSARSGRVQRVRCSAALPARAPPFRRGLTLAFVPLLPRSSSPLDL